MEPQNHKKLIMERITKTYQKVTNKLEKAINMEAKNISKSHKLVERIDHLPKINWEKLAKEKKKKQISQVVLKKTNGKAISGKTQAT